MDEVALMARMVWVLSLPLNWKLEIKICFGKELFMRSALLTAYTLASTLVHFFKRAQKHFKQKGEKCVLGGKV